MQCLAITATHGRHECLERVVGFFLNQDYDDKLLFIHNNSSRDLTLDRFYDNVILVNAPVKEGGHLYQSLGDIYNHTLRMIEHFSISPEIACFMDDDDWYLPDHISMGVQGYRRARKLGKIAYKPQKSYYRHAGGIEPMVNTMEPSIFVKYDHLKHWGFSNETTAQHLRWVNPLIYDDRILVDPDGKPTLIYNWGPDVPTFKTSGDPNNPYNFQNYRSFSTDNGDGVITPLTPLELEEFYNSVG